MATGDRRLGSLSLRRGMTVLGKIPAVPKPINLPSQRLENRGLDPSVEIVPRGTFSWGTGRSPPTSGSSWGTVGLSSSPPVSSGAWNTASTSSSLPSSNNNLNLSRPMSAGSARPASAGSSRPLSASTVSGRAWGGAVKLEEQVQPSRFNLTTAEFPTLGSEKNLNLRPQQTPSNRPTSADAMKERHLAYGDRYQSGLLVERPTSADCTKERKPVFPGVSHADRPTSADGTLPDKGRQQQALLPSHPPFADGTLPDRRHLVYTGVVGHGTAGPGPGTLDRPKNNFSGHPVPVQHGVPAQGRELVFTGAPQHDRYYNRPGFPPGNNVVVLPMDARPEFYGSYAFDLRPNHPDMSRVHHPQPSWGPNHLERSEIPHGQFLQSGPSEHFHIMRPSPRRMEVAVLHEPGIGNRRDGFGINDEAFGEHRGGWPGTNVVYIGSAIDARESSIPMTGTGPRPDMFLPSWGPQPMHPAGTVYGADRTMGVYQDMPSSAIHQQTKLVEMPQGSAGENVSDITENSKKGTACIDEVVHSRALEGHHSAASGNSHMVGQDMQYLKQEETIKTSSVKILAASPDISKNKNNLQASGGPLVGTQPLKTKQEDGGIKAEQNREPRKVSLIFNMASQRQGNNCHGNLQGFHRDHFFAKDNPIRSGDDVKGTPKKKILNLQQSTKGMEEMDLSVHEREERTSFVEASDGSLMNCSNLSSADLLVTSDKDVLKGACTGSFSRTAENTQLKTAAKDLKITAIPNRVLPVSSEEEKALLDDGLKTKRNGHSLRRTHGRSLQESHSVDRQLVNHGLVWAPKPTVLGATKEEVQVPSGDAGDMHESLQKISTDLVKKRRTQPALEHESKRENQLQQMSAASSQQGQGQQVQEQPVMNSKRSAEQVQHQRGERSSKKQGHRIQQQQARSNIAEQSVQDEQSVQISLHIKHQQSVTSSQAEPPGGQVTAVSEREELAKQIFLSEEAEKAGEATSTPALEKSEGKRNNSGYVRKPARNQHRAQREQEHEGVSNHHGQRFYSKEEKFMAEDLEYPESRKNHKEFKSRNSKNAKQQKADLHESATSLVSGEGHVLSAQVESKAETCVPYLAVEAKVLKDKEERAHNQKLGRQQEMHIKQSATGEHRHFGEERKADTLSCESSTIRTEKKLYVPKQARKLYLQQDCEATGSQSQIIQEVEHSSNEKGQYDGQESQPSGTSIRKSDMERYTPLPARQPYMQGQQSIARGQRGQMPADLAGAQAIQPSSGYVGGQLANITDSEGKGDELQPRAVEHCVGRAPLIADSAHGQHRQKTADLTVAQAGKGDESHRHALGHTDESRLHESSESARSKKEVKHYVVKSGGQQQQSPSKVDEEAPVKEEKWQRSHRISATDSSKRKEGMKLYTPKPARQSETSVAPEGKAAKETGVPSLPELHDSVRNEREERIQEFDHFNRNRNHSSKALKYTPLSRSSKKSFAPLEDRNNSQRSLEGSVHVYGVDDTNGSVKEDKKDLEPIFPGLKRGTGDARPESPSLEDVEVAKPRQYLRRHYQYQPVTQQHQMVKPQVEEFNAHRQNNKQADQGHNRYERREGPRQGRGRGYGYRAGEHADSSDMR